MSADPENPGRTPSESVEYQSGQPEHGPENEPETTDNGNERRNLETDAETKENSV